MKKLLITSVLMGLACSAFSQFKYFFPDSNAYFSVGNIKYWFQGDTVIKNVKYKKVYLQHSFYDTIDFSRAGYYAAIREDTMAEKVYCIYSDWVYEEKEYLLYDFSVNVGDTVGIYYYFIWHTQVVKSIDSLFIDGSYRKRINFDNGIYGKESWIEGIGSTYGLFDAGIPDLNLVAISSMNCLEFLRCVHIDGRLIYQADDTCYQQYGCYIPPPVNITEHKEETFKIYPTIAENMLYIETDANTENVEYKIMNLQGQIVNSGMIANTISISNLSSGFYFITILDSKRYIKTQKFIKY